YLLVVAPAPTEVSTLSLHDALPIYDTTNDTNDLVWERAVAAAVDFSGTGNQFRMAGFMLGDGTGLTIRDSVAVGIPGTLGIDRSGLSWPEHAESTWTSENNIAHTNETHGTSVWPNNSRTHPVAGF